jgi:hypothetical protein
MQMTNVEPQYHLKLRPDPSGKTRKIAAMQKPHAATQGPLNVPLGESGATR